MATANVNHVGQIDMSGDQWALFLKIFGGEVLTAYEDANVTQGTLLERTISNGKSVQFPAIGKIGSGYHTPGAEITGQRVPHNEVTIEIDGLLYSDVFLDDVEEIMNHYDVRGPYTMEMGRELARTYDINNLRTIIQAADTTNPIVAGHSGGTTVDSASASTSGSEMVDNVWEVAQAFDEKNVPADGRRLAMAPAQYYLVAAQTDQLNRDYGGRGSIATAEIPIVANIPLIKCNHIPNTDLSSDTSVMEKYRHDYSKVQAVVWHQQAAGVCRLKGLSVESNWDFRRQGTLIIAKQATGHGPLRPDSAAVIRKT